jgi:hypothetical protein
MVVDRHLNVEESFTCPSVPTDDRRLVAMLAHVVPRMRSL